MLEIMEIILRKTAFLRIKYRFSHVKQQKSESHNPKVIGSNPAPAIQKTPVFSQKHGR